MFVLSLLVGEYLLKMNSYAQPLKMALHGNVGVEVGHIEIVQYEKVIFLLGSEKTVVLQ